MTAPGEYLAKHPHFVQGREYERERIIALLNEHIVSDYDCGFLVSLIKGENE